LKITKTNLDASCSSCLCFCVLKIVEEVEEWKPDIIEAVHRWYPPSLDESKRKSTMISKDLKKVELVIETRFCICGDQVMTHGIWSWTVDLDFIIGNVFVGVTAYQAKNGGNPMQHEYVHGTGNTVREDYLSLYLVYLYII
jgi:hypothetical protein